MISDAPVLVQQPVWLAALLSGSCSLEKDGEFLPLHWQYGRDYALYTALEPVTIHPFRLPLSEGETVEVHWNREAASYRLQVYSA